MDPPKKRSKNQKQHEKERAKRMKKREDKEKAEAAEAQAKYDAEKADEEKARAQAASARVQVVRTIAGNRLINRIGAKALVNPMVAPGIGPAIRAFTPGPPRTPTPSPEKEH